MDSAIVVLVAVLAFLPKPTQDPQSDAVTVQRMKERQIFLEEKMSELWEEIEWRRALEEVPLLWILQHWLFWVAVSAVLCWLAWQREQACRRRWQQDSSGEEEEGELSGGAGAVWPFGSLSLPALWQLSSKGWTLKKMMEDLLEVCQLLSQNTFMPELHPATGKQGTIQSWHDLGDCIVCQLVVCLRPPPRHSFHLQLPDNRVDVPERRCRIRVLLECSCSRTSANPWCFAHPTYGSQHSPVLRSLCTDGHLEVEKVTAWVQELVQSAWDRLPQWNDWQLQVLPSSRSCRFLLTGPRQEQLCLVLLLALQHGRPGTFVVLE